MSNKGTPKEDFERFDEFIDGMTDMEYEIWYANDATSKQKQDADTIREEVQEEDAPEEIRRNENQIVRFFRRLFKQ